jgi:hypothetical protein
MDTTTAMETTAITTTNAATGWLVDRNGSDILQRYGIYRSALL